MKQVVQPVSGGPVEVLDVPRPVIGPTEVLVRTVASVISPGTERAVTALARSSLLAKARARPDLVRQVVRKAQAEGIPAAARAVRGRLAADLPLGYSAAGLVAEVGAAVDGIASRPAGGDRRRRQGQPRRVPGRAAPAVRGRARRGAAAGRGVRHPRVHPAARAAPVRGRPGRQGRGARPRAASASSRRGWRWPPAATWPGSTPTGSPGRPRPAPACWPWTSPATRPRDQILRWSRGRGADTVLVCAADRSPQPMSQGAGAVPGPGRRGDGGRRGHAAPPRPVLRAGDLAAVRPLLRAGPVRAVL